MKKYLAEMVGTMVLVLMGCGINFWPMRVDFSYALADKDCLMHQTWQLGFGIVF